MVTITYTKNKTLRKKNMKCYYCLTLHVAFCCLFFYCVVFLNFLCFQIFSKTHLLVFSWKRITSKNHNFEYTNNILTITLEEDFFEFKGTEVGIASENLVRLWHYFSWEVLTTKGIVCLLHWKGSSDSGAAVKITSATRDQLLGLNRKKNQNTYLVWGQDGCFKTWRVRKVIEKGCTWTTLEYHVCFKFSPFVGVMS